MQAIGRRPQWAPDGAPVYCERPHPEQTTLHHLLHHLLRQHAASFMAHTEASASTELPRFITDEFDAFLECGILAGARASAPKARPFMSTQRGLQP